MIVETQQWCLCEAEVLPEYWHYFSSATVVSEVQGFSARGLFLKL